MNFWLIALLIALLYPIGIRLTHQLRCGMVRWGCYQADNHFINNTSVVLVFWPITLPGHLTLLLLSVVYTLLKKVFQRLELHDEKLRKDIIQARNHPTSLQGDLEKGVQSLRGKLTIKREKTPQNEGLPIPHDPC
jgi:hypothetical protein